VAGWLGEAGVEETLAGARAVGDDPVKDLSMLFVAVEILMYEVKDQARRLGVAPGVGMVHGAMQRVGKRRIVGLLVTKERSNVTNGGQTEAGDPRVGGDVDQLVQPARLKTL